MVVVAAWAIILCVDLNVGRRYRYGRSGGVGSWNCNRVARADGYIGILDVILDNRVGALVVLAE